MAAGSEQALPRSQALPPSSLAATNIRMEQPAPVVVERRILSEKVIGEFPLPPTGGATLASQPAVRYVTAEDDRTFAASMAANNLLSRGQV
mmetsp:Transcript_42793/g.100663  ORF Transcript_42793/g.100663 Transcript_42793/m.100663 type:complete len:91 (+) Transcript_42793:1-273(+)